MTILAVFVAAPMMLNMSHSRSIALSASVPPACSTDEVAAGLCGTDSGGITIGDTETDGGDTPSDDGGGTPGEPGAPDAPRQPTPREVCAATPGPPSAFCRSLTPVGVPVGQPPSPAGSGWRVTVSDLARFVPSTATVAGEPDNVAVVGLPANFVSSATTETVQGTILGRALVIRFTPDTYTFDYGDGGRRTSTSPGVPWGASGQAQFTPTDTSHVYTARGIYTVTVTVTYAADVDLGAGWVPINGTLDGPPASQQVRVVTAHTALVQGTCKERPGGPGC